MSDNVLILGAGFSRDAGIPVMRDFVDRMLDIAFRGKVQGKDSLEDADLALLKDAMEIREN